ncbi:conserved unknown protein [Ectocarpus siliculosus]|uniref:CW-type domain-containing protein n=1 Tax=Ectocarpus siliculosus TaxID=2880 RepID=D8LD53_ECTSI|nr:conserved unknown protein [Ectocarpus siliculosus]|eukprot:CBN78420.1 conserved unknown protein [Ectocarpus siliculosus]
MSWRHALDDDDEEEEEAEEKRRRRKQDGRGRRQEVRKRQQQQQDGGRGRQQQQKRRGNGGPSDEGVVWVQCDTCKKWRRLPDFVDPDQLPLKWHCEMNIYDAARANCRAKQESSTATLLEAERKVRQQKRRQQQQQREEEEDDEEEESDEESRAKDANLRRFLSGWARRIKCAEKAKSKLAPSMSTRGKRKAPSQAQWVRCQNCGKWRALLRCMDASLFLGHGQQFYCLMNTWNESLASCSAPQENQYTVDALFPPPEPARSDSDHDEDAGGGGGGGGHGMNRRDGGDSDYEGGGRPSSMYDYGEYNYEFSPGMRHGASSRAGGRGAGRGAEREGWYHGDEYY